MSIYFLDLETTGLDPKNDLILEIAVGRAEWDAPTKVEKVYSAVLPLYEAWPLSPFIVAMHTKNGLLPECYKSKRGRLEVEADILTRIPEIRGGHTLAGNSVHFDLSFLKQDMPRLAARFSHRLLDVSAIKLFARTLGLETPKGEPAHRAWEDVLSSARELEDLQRLVRAWAA